MKRLSQNRLSQLVTAIALLALVTACAAGDSEQEAATGSDSAPVAADTSMQGMEGMPGMEGMQPGGMTGTIAEMRSRLEMMEGMSPDSVQSMLPQHRQMAANLLAEMNREMQAMKMAPDTAWAASLDSLRQDLTRMPEMSALEMATFMPAHRQRMMRLMEMHQQMMGGMGM